MLAIIAIAAGILLGAFSGLVPGIHSNTVASVLASLPLPAEALPFLIAAVLAAHIIFQFFPSVFLSIPDDEVVVSVLPGHRMALEGRGREAIMVCATSALAGAAASALLLPFAIAAMPLLYSFVQPNTALLLILASAYLLAAEREGKKIALAAFVFLLSGALGIVTTRIAVNDPLFPAFCGLFAASGILLSFTSVKKLPAQIGGETRLDFGTQVAAGVALGMLSDLLPGIAAPAQIAIFASVLFASEEARKYLALLASIAASHAVFAFGAVVSIGKAREGALAILNEVSPILPSDLPALVGVFLLSAGICAALLAWLSKYADRFSKMDVKGLNVAVLAYLICAVAIVSGALGLALFATSAAVGVLPPLLGIRRTHVMGAIIIPSIILAL